MIRTSLRGDVLQRPSPSPRAFLSPLALLPLVLSQRPGLEMPPFAALESNWELQEQILLDLSCFHACGCLAEHKACADVTRVSCLILMSRVFGAHLEESPCLE